MSPRALTLPALCHPATRVPSSQAQGWAPLPCLLICDLTPAAFPVTCRKTEIFSALAAQTLRIQFVALLQKVKGTSCNVC